MLDETPRRLCFHRDAGKIWGGRPAIASAEPCNNLSFYHPGLPTAPLHPALTID